MSGGTSLRFLAGLCVLWAVSSGCRLAEPAPRKDLLVLERLLELDAQPSGSPRLDREVLTKELGVALLSLESTSELGSLWYETNRLGERVAGAGGQEDLQRPNVFFAASQAVLFRLAQLSTKEGAETLVRIFSDPKNRFDGEAALDIRYAISCCAQLAKPYLEEVSSPALTREVSELLAVIDAGRTYGP